MNKTLDQILSGYSFVRETAEDLYLLLEQGFTPRDVVKKIIPEGTKTTELFTLSLYLYNFNPIKRRFLNNFYFSCDELFNLDIDYMNQSNNQIINELYTLSYYYEPTPENPFHFQLAVKDSQGNIIPRETKKNSEYNHNKKLAKFIMEQYLTEAYCKDFTQLKSWDLTDTNSLSS